MTTNQSPALCADCFTGTLRGDVRPAGTEETLHGLPTYVARPEAGKEPIGVVVIITDAFGWKLLNTRALADAYARRVPAVVLVPEFMNGHSFPTSYLTILDKIEAAQGWWARTILRLQQTLAMVLYGVHIVLSLRPAVTLPRIAAYLRAVRAAPPAPLSPGAVRIGTAGFCWGGKFATMVCWDEPAGGAATAARPQPPLVDCSFTAHPALLALPADAERAAQPLAVAGGTADDMLPEKQLLEMKQVLEAKGGEVIMYQGGKHGFAVRGDPNDPKQAEMGLQAEDQAVNWFRKFFAK